MPALDKLTEDVPALDMLVDSMLDQSKLVVDKTAADKSALGMLVDSMPDQSKLVVDKPALDLLVVDIPVQDELVADKPALDMLVDSRLAQDELVVDKLALDMLVESMPDQSKLVEDMPVRDKLVEDMPAQGELVVDELLVDKPALDVPVDSLPDQSKLVVDKLGEQHKGKLHQKEADSSAVVNYVCIIKKLEDGEGQGCKKKKENHKGKGEWVIWGLEKENRGSNGYNKGVYKKAETGEELWIGMDPLRGGVSDSDRPDISCSIRSIKCTVMLNVLCKRDWCVVEMYPVWLKRSRDLSGQYCLDRTVRTGQPVQDSQDRTTCCLSLYVPPLPHDKLIYTDYETKNEK
jgi:hypothetical protein